MFSSGLGNQNRFLFPNVKYIERDVAYYYPNPKPNILNNLIAHHSGYNFGVRFPWSSTPVSNYYDLEELKFYARILSMLEDIGVYPPPIVQSQGGGPANVVASFEGPFIFAPSGNTVRRRLNVFATEGENKANVLSGEFGSLADGAEGEVKEVKGSKIILVDGAELELDPKFVPFSERGNNQAVYRIVKGDIDFSKHTKKATLEHARTVDGAPKKVHNVNGGAVMDLQNEAIKVLKSSLCKKLCQSEDCKHDGAVAPFGFLLNFDKFIQAGSYSDEVKSLSKLIHCCFTPVTNTFFAFSGKQLDSALSDFIADCQNKEVKFLGGMALEGRSEYENHCKSNYDELMKSCEVSGGGYSESFAKLQAALAQVAKVHSFHLSKLLKRDIGCDDEKAKWYAGLCWARCFECCELKQLSEGGDEDCKESIHDMCDVIQDLSLGGNSGVIASDKTLQPMIISYLEAAQDFSKDDMCCFPLRNKAVSEQGYKSCMSLAHLYSDESASKLLKSLSAEQLAQLLSQ